MPTSGAGMADWPRCLGERETLERMRAGDSVARLGDGEIGIALGGGTATHRPNPRLAAELRGILKTPAPGCLPAIPTMDARSPRFANWVRYRDRYRTILDMDRIYGSAFVGQTVSAPWIGTAAHADEFRRLWTGKHVVALCPDRGGLNSLLPRDAAAITWVLCPATEAYSVVDDLERSCLTLAPRSPFWSPGLARRFWPTVSRGMGSTPSTWAGASA